MFDDRFGIGDRNGIITGASSGIGKATAERFTSEGANVAICSRTREDIETVADQINEGESTGRAFAMECDVRDREQVEAFIEATVEEFDGLDFIVNNAGGDFMAPFEEISENGWDAVVDINLNGTFRCSQVAGEYLRRGDGGDIVNISSMFGRIGIPKMAHYGASKAGINHMTETLAAEWSDHDVQVNAIAPGFIQSPALSHLVGWDEKDIPPRSTVNRQIGYPEEVADVIQFLLSPASSFITGEVLSVKGTPYIKSSSERLEEIDNEFK